jgi:hypothetical protein
MTATNEDSFKAVKQLVEKENMLVDPSSEGCDFDVEGIS